MWKLKFWRSPFCDGHFSRLNSNTTSFSMGKPKAKSDGAKDKRVPGKWIHYLNKYRTDNSNVFEKTKDGKLAFGANSLVFEHFVYLTDFHQVTLLWSVKQLKHGRLWLRKKRMLTTLVKVLARTKLKSKMLPLPNPRRSEYCCCRFAHVLFILTTYVTCFFAI